MHPHRIDTTNEQPKTEQPMFRQIESIEHFLLSTTPDLPFEHSTLPASTMLDDIDFHTETARTTKYLLLN